jgi:hypothetical protein
VSNLTLTFIQYIESICPNIKISVCGLTNSYFLYNIETDEELLVDARYMLHHRHRDLVSIIYNFDAFGVKGAEDAMRQIKVKDTKLYKVLNSDD